MQEKLILRQEAQEIMLKSAFFIGEEEVDFMDSLGRISSQDVCSDINIQPFDKSAYDGFACRISELDMPLEVIEDIPAGKWPTKELGKNQCARIMTGAPIPKGAECIIPVEDTSENEDGKIVFNGKYKKSNIAKMSEDVKSGEIVIPKGSLIKAQHIAVMASVGCTRINVAKQPQIAVMSTGDELIEPNEKPNPSQIRNSNSYQNLAQLKKMGIDGNYYGIVRDDFQSTYDAIKKAIDENDLVILSGGVSMGDYDFVGEVLEKLNVKIKFSKVAIQPGKPFTFGIAENALILGLPGNPVSAFTIFQTLAKKLIYKMMNYDFKDLSLKLPMANDYSRKRDGRDAFYPAVLNENGEVQVIEYHGSAHINALTNADLLMMIPKGIKEIKKGDLVDVRQI
jgi:molybdopterin molybdotransferase